MGSFVLRGILIGMLFGIPVGVMGAMAAQRTLHYGMKAGLLTGLGSSAADCFYACVCVFGLTFISDFLLKYQEVVNLFGGCLILWMGLRLFQRKISEIQDTSDLTGKIRMAAASFAVGITNPAAILSFLFAFSLFGISGQTGFAEGTGLVCGVFIGTYFWWAILSGTVSVLRQKTNGRHMQMMNRIFGAALTIFGVAVLVRNFLN